jgi:uncharacterized protein
MSATDHNRRLISDIFAALAQRNTVPFVEALADDVRWRNLGSSPWSGTWVGKPAVLDMLGSVRVQLVERIHLTVRRILADDDHVVVEASGRATTKTGKPYNNDYCFIYRLAGGKVVEITEYLDTALTNSALTVAPPPPLPAG